MTVYARADLACKIIPVEGFGGCGLPHSRPVVIGAPAKIWALDCPPCEENLRHDPQWSTTPAEIPETYDEQKTREDFDKRGARDKDAVLAMALAKIAGVELPESMLRMISGVPAHVPAELECPQGHGQPAGRKFCAECGSPMHGTAAAAAISAPQKAAQPPAAAGQPKRPPRLRDQPKSVLQALARQRGLDEDGTNGELIARLGKAGVTNNDLARHLEQPVAA